MGVNSSPAKRPLRLLLALDGSFEPLAAVSLSSFLVHNRLERVIVVTPASTKLMTLPKIASSFETSLTQIEIPHNANCESLDKKVKGYFYCIEAIEQACHGSLAHTPGRYLCVDADTLCLRNLSELSLLPLSANQPMAASSHGRPMVDRQLILELESPYHYFNAGVMLFDSQLLADHYTAKDVVNYYHAHLALCRFREQCALNALLRGKVRYLPNQYNYLSWMRPRAAGGEWHQLTTNPMAYCLGHVREEAAIAHLSAGAIPTRVNEEHREPIDNYWLSIDRQIKAGDSERIATRIVDFRDFKDKPTMHNYKHK